MLLALHDVLQGSHTGCKFDFGHSQSGIGLEFVQFVQSVWESTKNIFD